MVSVREGYDLWAHIYDDEDNPLTVLETRWIGPLLADGFILLSLMHPAMMLLGIQAQFCDPATGRKIRPASPGHQISDYVMAVNHAGLLFDHMSEHAVDDALAARSPRARQYVGWPLLLLMRLRAAKHQGVCAKPAHAAFG